MLAAATVHFPYMTAWPERASAEHRARTQEGFSRLGRAFEAAGVETILAVTSEHIVNLQPRLVPAFTVGVGAAHAAFPEPQFKLDPIERRGDPDFAMRLVSALFALGFDPAHSIELRLDHGTTLPLAQMGMRTGIAVVPLVVNTLFPPLPPLRRCKALGEAIGAVIRDASLGRRVGILATGGLSHTVGAPGMERNDPAFDDDFLTALLEGDLERVCGLPESRLDQAGNGTHEIRNWVIAAAAALPSRAVEVTRIPFAPGWNSGVHQVLWEAA